MYAFAGAAGARRRTSLLWENCLMVPGQCGDRSKRLQRVRHADLMFLRQGREGVGGARKRKKENHVKRRGLGAPAGLGASGDGCRSAIFLACGSCYFSIQPSAQRSRPPFIACQRSSENAEDLLCVGRVRESLEPEGGEGVQFHTRRTIHAVEPRAESSGEESAGGATAIRMHRRAMTISRLPARGSDLSQRQAKR
ncbi:hypothetical protein PHYPSEUDO_000045 [Phytophthora pseudosyringae]|uniref:Uncharacterized protein n=1 Tax=Phytophthora pseudosyringae TaxID=221518 RepID=A0A8T1WNA7_9STRA|nr:hypothetical protein PHYPSEUDO_000045 [Phytophthora pseudosyringae]